MPRKMRNDKLLNTKMWRYLVNFWTVVLYVAILADFLMKNDLVVFLGPISAIYIAALAVYTTQKEFERWNDYHVSRHPGERYVIFWTVLIISMLTLEFIYQDIYKLPSEVFTTYIVVIGVLAITKKSKKSYIDKKRG